MQRDRIVLILLWRQFRNSLLTLRASDLCWIGLGGGALVAYGVADAVEALRRSAEFLRREQDWLIIAVPSAAAVVGSAVGVAIGGLTWSRAVSPFLKALPLSLQSRRRMALLAAVSLGIPLTALAGALTAVCGVLIDDPNVIVTGTATLLLFALGFGNGLMWQQRAASRTFADIGRATTDKAAAGLHLSPIGYIDRSRPQWLGSWAWGLQAGRLVLRPRLVLFTLLLGIGAALSIGASIARHEAGPAALAAMLGGLLVFMLSLRCHPLASPAMRTQPVRYSRAWLRLLRLPSLLSALFFALPATAALAAEPSSWVTAAASGCWLLLLNGAYAAFAAYFATSPLAAALSFVTAIAYANYETFEYGRSVLVGFAALVFWLWYRARQRYYRG